MVNPHAYQVSATWESGRRGAVTAPDIEPKIRFSAAPEFKGDRGFWTPEHFLLAAVASCFVVTFYALADRSKMEFEKLDLTVEGRLVMFEGKLCFREIVLRPMLTIPYSQDNDRAHELLERTEHSCLIARTLACPVLMEPFVQIAEEILAS
jgi:peroxiredoxin-like protein